MLDLKNAGLTELLNNFYTLTGLKLCIFDTDFEECASTPIKLYPLCLRAREDPEFERRCHSCDAAHMQICRRTRKPLLYRCHAGLTEYLAPLYYEGVIVAFICIGMMTDGTQKEFESIAAYTAQFGMGDGEGRQLVMKVIYTPDADCIQFRAGYPFNVDRSVLPIARSFICKRNYEMRYTRIELDARDGEVYICLVMRVEDPAEPPASFVRMLNLTISTGFDEYDTLRRYSRAQFTDEERAEFLAEVELISPLMLE